MEAHGAISLCWQGVMSGQSDDDAQVDREQWIMEYQQVAPQLQVRIDAADARDWRSQLESAVQHQQLAFSGQTEAQLIKTSHAEEGTAHRWRNTRLALQQLKTDIAEQLGQVKTREQFLNNEFASRTDEFRNKRENFDRMQACSVLMQIGMLVTVRQSASALFISAQS
jgi:Intra-flagellar transport protein 57